MVELAKGCRPAADFVTRVFRCSPVAAVRWGPKRTGCRSQPPFFLPQCFAEMQSALAGGNLVQQHMQPGSGLPYTDIDGSPFVNCFSAISLSVLSDSFARTDLPARLSFLSFNQAAAARAAGIAQVTAALLLGGGWRRGVPIRCRRVRRAGAPDYVSLPKTERVPISRSAAISSNKSHDRRQNHCVI